MFGTNDCASAATAKNARLAAPSRNAAIQRIHAALNSHDKRVCHDSCIFVVFEFVAPTSKLVHGEHQANFTCELAA